jgi:hypothetical protein
LPDDEGAQLRFDFVTELARGVRTAPSAPAAADF